MTQQGVEFYIILRDGSDAENLTLKHTKSGCLSMLNYSLNSWQLL